MTAAHVINTGQRYYVRSGDVESPAEVFGAAPCEDLAVLRVQDPLGGAPLALDGSPSARQGETVIALGFPEASESGTASSTRGVVSAPAAPFTRPRRGRAGVSGGHPHRHGARPGLLRRAAGRSRRSPRRRQRRRADRRTPAAGGSRAPTTRSPPSARARCSRSCAPATRSAGSGRRSATPRSATSPSAGCRPASGCRASSPRSPAALAGLRDGDYVVAVDGRPQDGTLSGWCGAAAGVRSGETLELSFLRSGRSRTVSVRLD